MASSNSNLSREFHDLVESLKQLRMDKHPEAQKYLEATKALQRYAETNVQIHPEHQLSTSKQRVANLIRPLYVSIKEYQEADEVDKPEKWRSVRLAARDTVEKLGSTHDYA